MRIIVIISFRMRMRIRIRMFGNICMICITHINHGTRITKSVCIFPFSSLYIVFKSVFAIVVVLSSYSYGCPCAC